MNQPSRTSALASLVAQLKSAVSRDNSLSRQALVEGWDKLKEQSLRHATRPTPPVMAGLILNDSRFAQLLDGEQRAQLEGLVKLAIERFEERTNPPNKLGNTIAGIIKDSQ